MTDEPPQFEVGNQPTVPPTSAPPVQSQNWSQPPQPGAGQWAQPAGPPTDPTGGLVPYKNPKALASYYLGLFSFFPLLGAVLGIFALKLGKEGLAHYKLHPETKGSAHAKVGIGCGAFGLLLNLVLIVGVIILFTGHAVTAEANGQVPVKLRPQR